MSQHAELIANLKAAINEYGRLCAEPYGQPWVALKNVNTLIENLAALQSTEPAQPVFCKILPELPKPAKLRRQIRKDGGYDMVPAYTDEEMYKYGELCIKEVAPTRSTEQRVPMTDAEIAAAWIRIDDPVALGSKFSSSDAVREFVRAIEAHHGIKPKGE